MRVLFALLLLLLSPTLAFAHTGVGDTTGFAHGFSHPIGGIDHILAMLAVGVFAYALGGKALWLVPLSFVIMMVAGFALGVGHVAIPFVELGIALSSIVIGAAASMGRPISMATAMGLVGVFALFHGHAHGSEMPETGGGLIYAAGFIMATALLHLAGIATSFGAANALGRRGSLSARLAGSICALGGVGVLAGWL